MMLLKLDHNIYGSQIIIACKYIYYMRVYRRTKNFCWTRFRPIHLPLHYRNGRIIFHPCSKDHHRLYAIINTGQKIPGVKILPMTVTMVQEANFFLKQYRLRAIVEYWTLDYCIYQEVYQMCMVAMEQLVCYCIIIIFQYSSSCH